MIRNTGSIALAISGRAVDPGPIWFRQPTTSANQRLNAQASEQVNDSTANRAAGDGRAKVEHGGQAIGEDHREACRVFAAPLSKQRNGAVATGARITVTLEDFLLTNFP